MSTRRDFLALSVGTIGAAVPLVARSQVRPCPPPLVWSDDGSPSATTSCSPSTTPAYIADMAPFQVRALRGNYAPANGTSSLRSVMPAMWGDNDDIMRPWSGGAKSESGTKMYVHGGGHMDSSNNGLYSFDFAGDAQPTGWAVENAGRTGVSGDFAVGTTGMPTSVHTYDGMVDTGPYLYRFGGSSYPQGGFTSQFVRYDKAASTWTRIPSGGYAHFGGMALANPRVGKILVMERWVTYTTYAFYRTATNDWGTQRSVSGQWPTNGSAAYDPATNTGLCASAGNGYGVTAFSIGIDWGAETVSQTARSMPGVGNGPALLWDPTRRVYWCFGASANNSVIYEINPTSFAVTSHNLTGDAPLQPEGNSQGTYGRWVFMDSWRAIGSVASRTGSAFVIRLP